MRDEVLIESLRDKDGVEIEVNGTRFKRVESQDREKVIWYVWGGIMGRWFFSSNTWTFEAVFQLGQDNS